MASMAVDAPMVVNPTSGFSRTDGTQVRYSPGRKRNFWERASPMEKFLMVLALILLLLVVILSAVLNSYSGSPPVKVVHISSTNGSTSVQTNGKAFSGCIFQIN
ncbi:endothelin-converting enzyme [Trichonephila clavata]|uniref:Endothelin-converting enzyme n=1 Tax=Trichonephila clavata TaxID=2740835 RepID=A0A8X6H0I8_TRICU|nr:endothelin-converting enzyme [Trichonephila clavata]